MKIIQFLPARLKLPFQLKSFFGQNHSPFRADAFLRLAASCLLSLQLSFAPMLSAAPPEKSASTKTAPAKSGDPVLKVMQAELSRAGASLSKADPAPYFVSYTVNDQDIVVL